MLRRCVARPEEFASRQLRAASKTEQSVSLQTPLREAGTQVAHLERGECLEQRSSIRGPPVSRSAASEADSGDRRVRQAVCRCELSLNVQGRREGAPVNHGGSMDRLTLMKGSQL